MFIPTGLTGDYSVFVITDRNDYVVENNNTNNTSAPYGVTLTLPPPAEMSVYEHHTAASDRTWA